MAEPTIPWKYLIAGGLLLLCLIVGAWWLDRQDNRPQQDEAEYRHWAYSVQPETIEDWMTFNYLNHVFDLPPIYLENILQIQDVRYPNISIRQYAESRHLDDATFLAQVRAVLALPAATSTP